MTYAASNYPKLQIFIDNLLLESYKVQSVSFFSSGQSGFELRDDLDANSPISLHWTYMVHTTYQIFLCITHRPVHDGLVIWWQVH